MLIETVLIYKVKYLFISVTAEELSSCKVRAFLYLQLGLHYISAL